MLITSAKPGSFASTLDAAEREKVLLENIPEVRYIARRLHDRLPAHVLFDDLVHAGIIGLIDAVNKFDPRKNVPLKSYARFRIRGAIIDSMRQLDWSPRNLRRQARNVEETHRELASELGRAALESEVAGRLGMPLKEFQHLLGELRGLDLGSLQVRSVDGLEEDFDGPTSRAEDDPFQLTLRAEVRVLLDGAISQLDAKERQVLALYYLEELTMREVGLFLNIGESRVSQIHTGALIRLRARMKGRPSSSIEERSPPRDASRPPETSS
jgi:RNA polymerase sigma factor for flagellar operon FliA